MDLGIQEWTADRLRQCHCCSYFPQQVWQDTVRPHSSARREQPKPLHRNCRSSDSWWDTFQPADEFRWTPQVLHGRPDRTCNPFAHRLRPPHAHWRHSHTSSQLQRPHLGARRHDDLRLLNCHSGYGNGYLDSSHSEQA